MEHGRSRRKRNKSLAARLVPVLLVLLIADAALFFFWVVKPEITERKVRASVLASEAAEESRARELESLRREEEALRTERESREAEERLRRTSSEAPETTEETLPPEPEVPEGFLKVEPAQPGVLTFSFAGDILFDEHYAVMASLLERSGGAPDVHRAFDEGILAEMRGADLFVVNNEFTYSDRGTPTAGKQYTFRARPEFASLLTDMGADAVTLANNHAFDYGEDSLLDTLDTLDAIGMPHAGAGRDLSEAARPLYFFAEGRKIALIAATQIERSSPPDTRGATDSLPGVFRCLKPDRLLEEIRRAKESCDLVIVCVHWGTEGTTTIDWMQEQQAPLIAEAGADLIIGGHPHVLQKIGTVKGVPIIYSLGNFWFNSRTLDTGLFSVSYDLEKGELSGFRFVPALQSGCRTRLLAGDEKQAAIGRMQALSKGVKLDEDGNVTF